MNNSSSEFALFSTLPTEIRLRIWSLSFLIRRLIVIRTKGCPGKTEYLSTRNGIEVSNTSWAIKCSAPPALSVCRESRREALTTYTFRFDLVASGPQVVYFNPFLDTVYVDFESSSLLRLLLDDLRAFDQRGRGIRLLAVSYDFFMRYRIVWFECEFPLHYLDSLTLVVEDNHEQCLIPDCALGSPSTDKELRLWEEARRDTMGCFFAATRNSIVSPDFKIAAMKKGELARFMSENNKMDCILEGPIRPYVSSTEAPAEEFSK